MKDRFILCLWHKKERYQIKEKDKMGVKINREIEIGGLYSMRVSVGLW
jgi:hypothetical protein